jgi:hypothetical protein
VTKNGTQRRQCSSARIARYYRGRHAEKTSAKLVADRAEVVIFGADEVIELAIPEILAVDTVKPAFLA